MVVCNEDVAGIDGSIECSWYLTSRMSNPDFREVEERTRHLLRQISVVGSDFICPTNVKISVSCLDPSRRLEPRRDRNDETLQRVEVHSPDCVSREVLFSAIDDVECTAETIQFSNLVEYEELSVNVYVDGEDRWVDRESEYLVGWDSFGDQKKPDTEVSVDDSSSFDPLEIVLSHGPNPDGTYEHDIEIRTFCHLWWANTAAGG